MAQEKANAEIVVDPVTGKEVSPSAYLLQLGITPSPDMTLTATTPWFARQATPELLGAYARAVENEADLVSTIGHTLGYIAVPSEVLASISEARQYSALRVGDVALEDIGGAVAFDSELPLQTTTMLGETDPHIAALLKSRVEAFDQFVNAPTGR